MVVLAQRGVTNVHTVTLDKRKHLSVLSCINVAGKCIPNFYIFMGKQMTMNYVHKYEVGVCMSMQLKTWMTTFIFNMWLFYYAKCIQNVGGNLSPSKHHLSILDGHNLHVTIDVVR